jgi:hypothetical protein
MTREPLSLAARITRRQRVAQTATEVGIVSTTFIKIRRTAPSGRRRSGLAGLAAVLLALAIAPAASAAGWAITPTPSPGKTFSTLSGVSCPSRTTTCTAVGYADRSPGVFATLAERWNGTSWTVQPTPNPTGARSSHLSGISCAPVNPIVRRPVQCMAVGGYVDSTRAFVPLAEFFNGFTWSITAAQVPPGANGSSLSGVSCVAATACMAVGTYFNSAAAANEELAEVWDGSTWTVQATPDVPSDSLNAVSCTFATACVAVGTRGNLTLTEHWNGSSWSASPNTVPGAQSNRLGGVSCTSPSACEIVGQDTVLGPTVLTLGAFSPGNASLFLQKTPSPGRTVSLLQGDSCTGTPEQCWAVGTFDTFRGTRVTLGEFWDGFQWNFENTPDPNQGFSPSLLNSVSCTSNGACVAVGDWQPSTSSELTLAEQFTGFGPAAWTLTAAGPVRDGTIVRPVLTQPRLIGLVVDRLPQRTLVGLVALGRHRRSKQEIRWNLKIGGENLGDGTYEVDLKTFTAAGTPTTIPGPPPERLVIGDGHATVSPY